MTEQEKIDAGLLFMPGDPELKAMKLKAHNLNIDFNSLHEDKAAERSAILKELIGEIGEGTFLQGPVTFHYGCHTKIGCNTFINFNFTVQDDARVTIGDRCNFGPNVTIVTPCHPMIAEERNALPCKDDTKKRLCYAKPVVIGDNCWFGANAVVCPGVTVGNNCVIGAGSVVTRDIPDNCFAAGNPCRVIREISDSDSVANMSEIWGDYYSPENK